MVTHVMAVPFPVLTQTHSTCHTVVINALQGCCGATLLFTGAVSRVCGGDDGSVPEVLFNIRPSPNAFKLCSKLKQCNDMACTNAYGTKDAHYLNK